MNDYGNAGAVGLCVIVAGVVLIWALMAETKAPEIDSERAPEEYPLVECWSGGVKVYEARVVLRRRPHRDDTIFTVQELETKDLVTLPWTMCTARVQHIVE